MTVEIPTEPAALPTGAVAISAVASHERAVEPSYVSAAFASETTPVRSEAVATSQSEMTTPTPMTAVELFNRYPRIAWAAVLSFLFAAVLVVGAMGMVNEGGGGRALIVLAMAGWYVTMGARLRRRSAAARLHAILTNGLVGVSYVFAIVGGDNNALLVLPLVLSAAIAALLLTQKGGFVGAPSSGNSVNTSWLTKVTASLPKSMATRPMPPPSSTSSSLTAVSRPPRDSAADLRTNSKVMFWLFAVALLGSLAYAVWNPDDPLAKSSKIYPHVILRNVLGVAILGGGVFAAIYLKRNYTAIAVQDRPYRTYGKVGGIGLIVLLFLNLSYVILGSFTNWRPSDMRSVFSSPVSFAEFDGRFGASAIVKDNDSERSARTSAQLKADVKPYLGRPVRWSGEVLDARADGIVALRMTGSTSDQVAGGNLDAAAARIIARETGRLGQDDVQVLVNLRNPDRAARLKPGQRVTVDGTLVDIGDPYPYWVNDGRVE